MIKRREEKNKPTYACGWWLSTHAVVVVTIDAADVKGKKRKEKKREKDLLRGVGG